MEGLILGGAYFRNLTVDRQLRISMSRRGGLISHECAKKAAFNRENGRFWRSRVTRIVTVISVVKKDDFFNLIERIL